MSKIHFLRPIDSRCRRQKRRRFCIVAPGELQQMAKISHLMVAQPKDYHVILCLDQCRTYGAGRCWCRVSSPDINLIVLCASSNFSRGVALFIPRACLRLPRRQDAARAATSAPGVYMATCYFVAGSCGPGCLGYPAWPTTAPRYSNQEQSQQLSGWAGAGGGRGGGGGRAVNSNAAAANRRCYHNYISPRARSHDSSQALRQPTAVSRHP